MKEYQFAHDKSITALKSYSYSKQCIVMRNRMVIVHVPCEDIENSKSWTLIEDKKTKYKKKETKSNYAPYPGGGMDEEASNRHKEEYEKKKLKAKKKKK